MKIQKIQLKNGYKRFHDLTIDLGDDPKRIVALVGSNGCGKSSVLDGILYRSSAWEPIGNKGQKDFQYHSMHKFSGFDRSNVIVSLIEGDFQDVRMRKLNEGKPNTIFSFRSPYRYNSSLKVSQVQAVLDIKLNSYGATTAQDLDDKIEENYRRLNVKYNSYVKENDARPSEAKRAIIEELNKSLKSCLDLEISSLGDVEASQGTLYFKKADHPTEFEFNVLSSGEKEVVDILLDLYLRKEEFNDTVFLFDEPELHINTSIQKKLLIEINNLIGENCQLWITTHSIGFLRALQEDLKDECQIIQFEDGMKLASTAVTLVPMKKTIAKWKEIFNVALDDLSHLICPKKIVYCEGRDSPGSGGTERGLDAQVFNTIFSEKYVDTLFVSSGGNTELDQRSEIAFAILSKVLSQVEILVLKDRDISSGRLTSDNDRENYLRNNPSSHRVLKRWEIENYLYDKEVLSRYCAENSLSFDAAAYDQLVTDVNNQNLKDDTPRIRNICGFTTSIKADIFKLNLAKVITPEMQVYTELESCIFNAT